MGIIFDNLGARPKTNQKRQNTTSVSQLKLHQKLDEANGLNVGKSAGTVVDKLRVTREVDIPASPGSLRTP